MANDLTFTSLLRAAKSGDADAEQQLIRANMPLVYAIAKRYQGRGIETEDLNQLGAIGLLKAIRRFDEQFHVCFSTYAVPMIAGEIKRFLRDDGIIRFSRSIKELAAEIRKFQQLRPESTIKELAQQLHAEEADIAAALASGTSPRSLDEPDPITGHPFGVSIPAESKEVDADNRLVIESLLRLLTPREQQLIRMRFFEEKTQSETGARLGISQVQVSRLEKKILMKLRATSDR